MPTPGYKTLVIPEGLYKQLEQHVEDSEGRYVTVSEVVRKALWDFLQKARSPSPDAD
jgi:Arc/MetJ-type ribon-helix-helix transcriptional regulator